MTQEYAYLAMNRFAYGADKMSRAQLLNCHRLEDAQSWLKAQLVALPLHTLPALNDQWSSEDALTQLYLFKQEEKADKAALAAFNLTQKTNPENAQSSKSSLSAKLERTPKMFTGYRETRKQLIEKSKRVAEGVALSCMESATPLQSKLLAFFSNHFSVTTEDLALKLLAPTFEIEAIAPHLTHTFSDMLVAVVQHPAMIIYLDNEYSVGPNSKVGINQRKKNKPNPAGLNENLAREILELHTLGVKGDYVQDDVIGLAKALTGWSIGSVKREEFAGYRFKTHTHEPGVHRVLNKDYAPTSQTNTQGIRILQDLAQHPETARHVCAKLVQHFINDNPPTVLVDAMTDQWLKTQGHIPSVMKTLIEHPLSWQSPQKYKTPQEFVISACRACGVAAPEPRLYKTLNGFGQGLFAAGTPAGYPDEQSAWLGTSALNSRIEWSHFFAQRIAKSLPMGISPVDLALNALGPHLSARTRQHLARAESKQQSIAMLLLSPEFQSR